MFCFALQVPTTPLEWCRVLFLCSCMLHVAAAVRRWLPELYTTTTVLLTDVIRRRKIMCAASADTEPRPMQFNCLRQRAKQSKSANIALRLDAAASTYRLFRDLIALSAELPAFTEAFIPVMECLSTVKLEEVRQASQT